MYSVKAYLCNKSVPAINVESQSISQLSVVDQVVLAKMLPLGKNLLVKSLQANLIAEESNLVTCVAEGGALTWERRAVEFDGQFSHLETLITIAGTQPDVPCFWHSSILSGFCLSPFSTNLIMIMSAVPVIGEIPEDKGDVCRLSDTFISRNTQTDLVPGEALQLVWNLKINNKFYSKPVAGIWFEGPSVTGGKIIEKLEDSNTNRYIVNVIGVDQECLATDWAEYPIGQWAYIFKQQGPEAVICDRQSTYNQSHQESFVFRLAPIIVNDYGLVGGSFEKKVYNLRNGGSDFARLFEASLHTGTLVEIYPEDDAAKVTVSNLGSEKDQDIEFDHIPIFYHCEGAEDTEGGSAAFSTGNEVLVLNEGGGCLPAPEDLSIIGFTDAVKPCLAYLKLTTLNGQIPSSYAGYKLSITQPVSKFNPLNRTGAKAVMEEYTALVANAACDANGVCKLPAEWGKDMDKTKPLHVWVSHATKIDLYTKDWRGDYPEYAQVFYFGFRPLCTIYNQNLPIWQWNPDLGSNYARHEWMIVESQTKWNLLQAGTTIVEAYDAMPLGHYSGVDIRNLPSTSFQAATGETVFGKQVSFEGLNQIRRDISMKGMFACETMLARSPEYSNSEVFSSKHLHRKSPFPYATYPPPTARTTQQAYEALPSFRLINGQLQPSVDQTTGHQIPYAHGCGSSGGLVSHTPPLEEGFVTCGEAYQQEVLCFEGDKKPTIVWPIGRSTHNAVSVSSSGCFQMVISAPRAGGAQEYPEYQFYKATGDSTLYAEWIDENGEGCSDFWEIPYATERTVEYVRIAQDNF
jgi:hypothetical protein